MDFYTADLIWRIIYFLVLILFGSILLFKRNLVKTNDSSLSIKVACMLLLFTLFSPNNSFFVSDFGFDGIYSQIEIINPYNFFSIVAIIVSTQAFGILLMNLMNKNTGTFLMALIGGIASSTTLTQVFGLQSRKIKGNIDDKTFAAISVIANGSSLLEKIFIISSINSELLKYLLPFLISHFLIGVIVGGFQLRSIFKINPGKVVDSSFFSLSPLILFAILYFAISIVNQLISINLEDGAVIVITGVSYLAGLNISLIEISERVFVNFSILTAINLVILAFIINIITKIISSLTLGTKIYFKWVTIGLGITLLLSILIQYVFYFIFVY